MADLVEIRAEIVTTKADLAQAKTDGKEALILMYGNNLAELRRKENNLEAGAGKYNFLYFLLLSTDE